MLRWLVPVIGISLFTGLFQFALAEEDNQFPGSACYDSVRHSSEFGSLKAKVPPLFDEKATVRHLKNPEKPSGHEAQLLQAFRERIGRCRRLVLRDVGEVGAQHVNAWRNHYAAMDAIYAITIRGEISWGEANQRFSNQTAKFREENRKYRSRALLGNGTGFFVTADGYIVTNAHVVRDNRRYDVLIAGREEPLELVDIDVANDLALVKVPARGRPIPIALAPPAKGEDVAALGYPVADRLGTEIKATFGKINALSGPRDSPRFLQTDASLQPGNSGGPLLNMRGEAIGIVAASFSTPENARRIGALPQNINYAVKVEYLVALLQRNIPGKWHRGSGVRFGSMADLVRHREASVVMILIR